MNIRTLITARVVSLALAATPAWGQEVQVAGLPPPPPQQTPMQTELVPLSRILSESTTGSAPLQVGNEAAGTMPFIDENTFVRNQLSGQTVLLGAYELAARKASSPAVKQFAATVLTDHQKARQELSRLASSRNLGIHEASGGPEQQMAQTLQAASAGQFDERFLSLFIALHEDKARAFEAAVGQAQDSDVKRFAQGELPVIRRHLEQAVRIRQQLSTQASADGSRPFTPAAG